ncbi:hypothetical protein NV381_22330 [Paenibacillus sp. N5-1-1-5]|uniref:Uncharacterized protein n=2 Tax=Paenibacillus radicis (ex Xue et al. 2023) TaxID=2972489 RepID=A0ABT1YNF8_9BACL|nr:hypothetical protein [Paenibacillus radicis (ex Xue et al. 2023)]
MLQIAFSLPPSNVHNSKLQDLSLDKFIEKCTQWAENSKEYALKYEGDLFSFPTHTAYEIGGRSFKDWFNSNWQKQERQEILKEIFSKQGMDIEINEKGYKSIYLKEVC